MAAKDEVTTTRHTSGAFSVTEARYPQWQAGNGERHIARYTVQSPPSLPILLRYHQLWSFYRVRHPGCHRIQSGHARSASVRRCLPVEAGSIYRARYAISPQMTDRARTEGGVYIRTVYTGTKNPLIDRHGKTKHTNVEVALQLPKKKH